MPRQITDWQEVVAPLTLQLPSMNVQGLGTCFIIGAMGDSAIALTAAHCLHEAEKHDIPSRVSSAPSALFTIESDKKTWNRIEIQGVLKNQNLPAFMSLPIEIQEAYSNQLTDIAFLLVTPSAEYADGNFLNTQIDVFGGLPSIGEDALVAGYFETEVCSTLHRDLDGKAALQRVSGRFQIIKSKVKAVHIDGIRDLHWPCIQIETPFYSGMSGGCVMVCRSGQWLATAVVSRDLSEADVASGAEAYAALIPAALNTTFPIRLYQRNGEDNAVQVSNILDLIELGVINIIGPTSGS